MNVEFKRVCPHCGHRNVFVSINPQLGAGEAECAHCGRRAPYAINTETMKAIWRGKALARREHEKECEQNARAADRWSGARRMP
jgi:transcription elongation factor Elf1